MSEPYVGEIRVFGFPFPPKGWALCNGQLLSIQQWQALFAILGTTYGGDGIRTFNLPNLQGRVALHRNVNAAGGVPISLGQVLGQESHTLLQSEVPPHTHQAMANTGAGTVNGPSTNVLSATTPGAYLNNPGAGTLLTLSPGTISSLNGGQPHENRQPFLVMSACISLQGVFPSRN